MLYISFEFCGSEQLYKIDVCGIYKLACDIPKIFLDSLHAFQVEWIFFLGKRWNFQKFFFRFWKNFHLKYLDFSTFFVFAMFIDADNLCSRAFWCSKIVKEVAAMFKDLIFFLNPKFCFPTFKTKIPIPSHLERLTLNC